MSYIASLASDNAVVLGVETITRTAAVLAQNWNKVRIGVRWSLTNDAGTGSIYPFLPIMGLCVGSGTPKYARSVLWDVAGVNHSAWCYYTGSNAVSTQTVGPPMRYALTYQAAFTTVNGGPVAASGDMELSTGYIGAGDTTRTLWFLDITKGSPNYTFQSFRNTSATVADLNEGVFLNQMQAITPSIANYAYNTAQTMAVDETANGKFDRVFFGHNMNSPKMRLSDLAVVVLS